MAIRVRVSELKLTVEVSGNGSGLIVTDSKAMARVEVDSLSKTGDLVGFAALAGSARPAVRTASAMITSFGQQSLVVERLVRLWRASCFVVCA